MPDVIKCTLIHGNSVLMTAQVWYEHERAATAVELKRCNYYFLGTLLYSGI